MKKITLFLKSEGNFLFILISYLVVIGLLAKQLPIEEWARQIENTGWIFMLSYWIIFIIRGFFLFPPVYFLLGLMVIYDVWDTIWIFMVGMWLSATVSFLIGRFGASHRFFQAIRTKSESSIILSKLKESGYKAIFMINLLGLSFDIPNYLAGYFRLKYSIYIVLLLSADLITTVLFTGVLDTVLDRVMS